jgi:hypothetical protein
LPRKEGFGKGRPLFVRELSKESPAPDTYDIKRNDSIEEV